MKCLRDDNIDDNKVGNEDDDEDDDTDDDVDDVDDQDDNDNDDNDNDVDDVDDQDDQAEANVCEDSKTLEAENPDLKTLRRGKTLILDPHWAVALFLHFFIYF